jgi:hypothetical protein
VKPAWIFVALLLAAGSAAAQMYKWVDKDGRIRYGDTPPPGAKVTSIKAPSSGAASPPSAPAAASKNAKDGRNGPMTPAEQEQDYRKRQSEARKEADKAAAEQRAKSELSEGCARTREYLGMLQSGQRIARVNPQGERYYLDESQVAAEIAKAQQSVQEACK